MTLNNIYVELSGAGIFVAESRAGVRIEPGKPFTRTYTLVPKTTGDITLRITVSYLTTDDDTARTYAVSYVRRIVTVKNVTAAPPRVAVLEELLQNVTTHLRNLSTTVKDLSNTISQLQARLRSLQEQVTSVQVSTRSLSSDLSYLSTLVYVVLVLASTAVVLGAVALILVRVRRVS